MAVQKALITNKADFIQAGVESVPITPLLFCNGEDMPTGLTYTGTPSYVDGVRGKAVSHNNNFAYRWSNYVFPNSTKRMISFWFKPKTSDLTGWSILATNRGLGATDFGVHLALYNGQFNFRLYASGSVNLYSDGTGGQATWTAVADTLYHCVWIHDDGATNKDEVYINGTRIIYNTVALTLGSYTRSLTVGDMLTSGGALQYTFEGYIDEFMYQSGEIWTTTQITNYRNAVLNKQMLDYWTSPGSLCLAKNGTTYASGSYTWESGTLDLGSSFSSYGRVQMVATLPSTSCTIILYTKSSSDGITWDAYQAVREDGLIVSTNNRYLKIKAVLATTYLSATPTLDELQVLDYSDPVRVPLYNEPLKIYKDLASGMEYAGELRNAYDIILDETINDGCTFTFKLPENDPKRGELGDEPVELLAVLGNRKFIIREATDERDESGKVFTSFTSEAFFYELRDFKVVALDLTQTTAHNALQQILNASVPSSGWTLGRCDIPSTKLRDFSVEWTSVLECIRKVVDTWGGEIVFDDVNKEISLLTQCGKDNGVRFYYAKNLKKITRTVNTYDLVTRLYPQGKGGLTIKTVNNNVEYLEDYTWVDALGLRNRVRIGQFKDENYIYPQNLKDDAEIILADSCKPLVSYVITVQDLSILSGHEHESFELGDTVYTVDKELLSTTITSRIVRRQYNVREPWKTVVELSQPKRLLSDAMRKSIDNKMKQLSTTDPIDSADVKQMTVFNYLLNSRGDEGLASWSQIGTGFTLYNAGFSGDWSYKCVGAYGATNQLTQRVYGVSHRTSYTISAAVASEGTITRGGTIAEPFVGLKVVIHYKDGTSETQYLNIADTTSN